MAEIEDLDPTDASNTGRFPENQAPSTVNNGARALEGLIARFIQDTNTSVVATLSGSVIQVTANRVSLTLTGTASNYRANLMQAWTMGSVPNTGPASLNIDGVGPISLRDNRGASLSSSVLLAGTRCLAVKDDANGYFRLLWPSHDTGVAGVLTTAGDIIYRNATVPARLAIGTAGQVLAVNSGATAPEWTALSAIAALPKLVVKLSGLTTTPTVTTLYNTLGALGSSRGAQGTHTLTWTTSLSNVTPIITAYLSASADVSSNVRGITATSVTIGSTSEEGGAAVDPTELMIVVYGTL